MLVSMQLSLLHAAALKDDDSPEALALAAEAGLAAIQQYGGAKRGDRTMLDALAPATDALKTSLQQGKQWSHTCSDNHCGAQACLKAQDLSPQMCRHLKNM